MLAKNYRLTKQKDFKAIFRKGKREFGRFFAVRYLKNDQKYPRIAVVASNKVSKSAVERNRIKRVVRDIIGLDLDKISRNLDIIVNISPKAIGVSKEDLTKDYLNLLKKAKII
jgi:ribonuclease P protein component